MHIVHISTVCLAHRSLKGLPLAQLDLLLSVFQEFFADPVETGVLLDTLGRSLHLLHNRFTAAELDRLDKILLQFLFLIEDAQPSTEAHVVDSLRIVRLVAEKGQNDQWHSEMIALRDRVVLRERRGL